MPLELRLGNLIVLASSLVCLLSAGAPGAAAGGAWAEARSAIAVTQAGPVPAEPWFLLRNHCTPLLVGISRGSITPGFF